MLIPAVTAVIQPVSHHTAATGLEKISIVWSAFLFIMAIFFLKQFDKIMHKSTNLRHAIL